MEIRKARPSDLPAIRGAYAHARELMRESGNPTQWGSDRPPETAILRDLELGQSYVVEEDGALCGVFALVEGEDPTYRHIEGGSWLWEGPYATIHRLASTGRVRGVFSACLAFCERGHQSLRADTHRDNAIMRHLLEKHGYRYCGVIYVDDGTPRLAYQKVLTGQA